MRIAFNDSSGDLCFQYHATIPDETNRLNLAAFQLYWLYRNTVYESYRQKPNLAPDIQAWGKAYDTKGDSGKQAAYQQDSLHHYSVASSLGAMQDWKNPAKRIRCFIAYPNEYSNSPVGFVHFKETRIDDREVVYIAEMGAKARGTHVGRRLLECVLGHYNAGMEFYVLTRVFNTEAKTLYQEKFNFSPIDLNQIRQLGYDERYCGFTHVTSEEEVQRIHEKQIEKGLTDRDDP